MTQEEKDREKKYLIIGSIAAVTVTTLWACGIIWFVLEVCK